MTKNLSADFNNNVRILLALFLHSLSIISFQIILMRILSITQWDHFANMIISIAMLGFGVSGTLLALTKQRLIDYAEKLIPVFMILSSVLMLLAYRFSQMEMLKFDTFLVFSSIDQLLRLVLFLFMFFLPFFFASLSIGMIYVKYVSGIGKLYFSNLVGSGIGGLLGLLILFYFLPENALIIVAFFPALASIFLIKKSNKLVLFILSGLFCLVILWSIIVPVKPSLSQYKSLAQTLQIPDSEVVVNKSGVSSQVKIIESEYLRYAPGLSLHFIGQVPVKPMVFINGNATGFIPKYKKGQTEDILDYTTFKLPYLISDININNAVIINSGTGALVAQALRKNVSDIYAVESEITLFRAFEKWEENNRETVYRNERVSLYNIESRAFFNNTREVFDLIVLPTVGSFGGGSGLQAIKEDFTLTTQAFNTYWDKLSDNGIIAITVYTDFPPRATIKIVASLANTLRNAGIIDIENHIAAIRSWTSITFIATKKSLGEKDFASITDFCDKMGFDPFIMMGISNEDRVFFNYIEDKTLFELTDNILKSTDSQSLDDYMFYVHPASDDKPYFARYIKISNINDLLKEYRWQELPFVELGYIIVWLTFIIALILSIILILLPIAWFKKSSGKLPVLFYFGAIGLGFMFAEIILIQRFVLYLGQPVYAVSAVISIMMLVSGLGSYYSSKVKPGTKVFYRIFIIIIIILLVYSLFLTGILRYTAGYSIFARIIITVIIVGIPAFFMGMPFPVGLKTLSIKKQNEKIAWGWGINGFFSVIATPLALIIAIEAGSMLVMSIAGLAYFVSLMAIYFIYKKSK